MTAPSPAVAPYVPAYANRSVYVTQAEYLATATGTNLSQLAVGRGAAQNSASFTRAIARASSWIDSICYQTIAATTDVQAGVFRVNRYGNVTVALDYSPVIYVTGISWGWTPSTLTALTDLSNVWPQGKIVSFPIGQSPQPSSIYPTGPFPGWVGSNVYATVTYVNGYANTTLSSAASEADTTITVADPTGIVPSLPIRIDDGTNPIQVTVDPTYVIGSSTVLLTAGLPAAYVAGSSVSVIPEAVKQACISLTSALVKTRGTQAFVAGNLGSTPSKQELIQAGAEADYTVAMDLLHPYVRVI